MGDRGNIVLEGFRGTDGGRIFLYTHWGGEAIYQSLANTLASQRGRGRWNDDTYLTRHIAEDLFEITGVRGEETGGGIGLAPADNEHLFIVLNHARQQVYIEVDAAREEQMAPYRGPYDYGLDAPEPWSFEQYITLVTACPPEMDMERFLLQAAGGTWPWPDDDEEEAEE